MMKETEKALEEIFTAFYDVVDVAEQNLPETTGDEDCDGLIQEQLDQYNSAIAKFQRAYKALKKGPEMRRVSEKLLSYYKDHLDDFTDDLEVLDTLTGSVGNYRCRPMASLNNLLGSKSLGEVLALGSYSGDESEGPFDPSRDYFYRNWDGGLTSTNYLNRNKCYLHEGVIQDILDNINRLHLSEGAQRIIDGSEATK